jgi:uncharacterized membrane protein
VSGLIKQLRKTFLTGLLILLPVIITMVLLWWGVKQADAILGNIIKGIHGKPIPGLGLGILVILILLAGTLGRNYLGKKIIHFGEELLHKIPIFKNIYGTAKQFTKILSNTEETAFRKVVLVEYPRRGTFSPGFLTGEAPAELATAGEAKLLSVFIPTVPNPTTGFLIFVPETEVTILQMSIEEGFKLIISAGVIKPKSSKAKKLLES